MRQIDRESKHNLNGGVGSPSGDGLRLFARSSQKVIEAVMQSAAKGKVVLKWILHIFPYCDFFAN